MVMIFQVFLNENVEINGNINLRNIKEQLIDNQKQK